MKIRLLIIPAVLILLFLLTCNLNSNKATIKTKGIEIKFLSIFPIDSSELFNKSIFQIFQPIIIPNGDSSIALNAFEEGYKIEILKTDNSGEKSYFINGKTAWWDIQLFGKPKIEKLNELAFSNFDGVRYEQELTKVNTIDNCELSTIQNKKIQYYDSIGFGILIFDTLCFDHENSTDSLYLNKYRVYKNYEDLLKGIRKMYTLKKEKFLIVHKLACCKPTSNTTIDTDQDGINDDLDKCPQLPGSKKCEGCPDQDNDGVRDEWDHCPKIMGSQGSQGCPDSDGDGVSDSEDKCPYEKGIKGNSGCKGIENFKGFTTNNSILFFKKDPSDLLTTKIRNLTNNDLPIVIRDYRNSSLDIKPYNLKLLCEYYIEVSNNLESYNNTFVTYNSKYGISLCEKEYIKNPIK